MHIFHHILKILSHNCLTNASLSFTQPSSSETPVRYILKSLNLTSHFSRSSFYIFIPIISSAKFWFNSLVLYSQPFICLSRTNVEGHLLCWIFISTITFFYSQCFLLVLLYIHLFFFFSFLPILLQVLYFLYFK